MIRFHNTLSGQVEPFVPLASGVVKLYTCGPTVYDDPHIGNWRAYVFEDLLKRFLMSCGYRVRHVMNITDVDDKTIRGAKAKGLSLDAYTRPFIEAFEKGRDALNILPADVYPRATAHIQDMVEIIKTLLEKGFAYRKNGSIYFDIAKFPAYGRLAKINPKDLRPGTRSDLDEYEKENVRDFALWKAPKVGEPVWETEIGPGRPGWHIECSAMSSRYLGRTFDIHCGGVDNIFPHHENEIAQSEAASGVKFVSVWLHGHHLVVDGEKMSKSKGNYYTLTDLLDRGYDPLDVRYLLMSTHYRKMLNFTFEALEQAKAARQRIGNFLGELKDVPLVRPKHQEVLALINKARLDFMAALEDDLNISEALASVFSLVKNIYPLLSQGSLSRDEAQNLLNFFAEVDEVLAVKPFSAVATSGRIAAGGIVSGEAFGVPVISEAGPKEASTGQGPLEDEILAKIEARQKARAAKDFKRADKIRRELIDAGIVLEDTKDGVRWKKIGTHRP